MNIRHLSLLSLSLLLATSAAAAYDYDDDDLYYNPDKAKKTETKKQPATAAEAGYYYVPNQVVDYQDPALYQPATGVGLGMDVDTYNRHGQFLVQTDSISLDELTAGDSFAYTRRLERFHDEDIVNGSGDQQLIDYYYSQPATTADVNIYVVNSDPWYSSWNSWNYPWYSPFSSYWYSPYWYNSFYGPSWSFNWSWGYDPWYSWSWGPGYWSPGYWGPGYWGPGWGGGPGIRPPKPSNVAVNNPGSSRPHTPAGNMTSAGSTAGRRPGAISVGASNPVTRPGSAATSGTQRYPGVVTPGHSTSRPGVSNSQGASVNLNRGRGTVTTTPSNTNRGMSTSTSRPASNSSSRSSSTWSSPSSSSSSRGSYRSSGGGGSSRGAGSGGSSTRGRR
ncbi:MAG: hypothetical protein K2M19_05035 [Muribaculaceae bacterium]|nr:hypothetical protein [Muribaculaceae bacterium]